MRNYMRKLELLSAANSLRHDSEIGRQVFEPADKICHDRLVSTRTADRSILRLEVDVRISVGNRINSFHEFGKWHARGQHDLYVLREPHTRSVLRKLIPIQRDKTVPR